MIPKITIAAPVPILLPEPPVLLSIFSPLLLTPDWLTQLQSTGHLRGREDVPVFLAEEDLMREIVGFNIHQAIMAVARIPAEGSLDNLPAAHLLVALDELRISENVGVIVRNCTAFGADAIIVGATSCSLLYLRTALVSLPPWCRMR